MIYKVSVWWNIMKIMPFLFANSNYAYFSNTKASLSFRISLQDLSVNNSVLWLIVDRIVSTFLSLENFLNLRKI